MVLSMDGDQAERTYTVSELAEFIGEKPRTIQFWADVGVIKPSSASSRKGKGVHRQFSVAEAEYAIIAHSLNVVNSPIGEIERVIDVIRSFKEVPSSALIAVMRDKFEDIVSRINVNPNENQKLISDEIRFSIADTLSFLGFYGAFEGEVYLTLAYERGKESAPLRFWSKSAMQPMGLEQWAVYGLKDHAGFKAIRFSSMDAINSNLRSADVKARETAKKAFNTFRDVAWKAVFPNNTSLMLSDKK
ncbi:hypothetical protein [Azospirillum argentinense]